MKEYLYYTRLNIPYALRDMFTVILPMIISAVVLHRSLETDKKLFHCVCHWIKFVFVTYAILTLLASLQYASYYDLYSEQIQANTILYALFWMVDVVLQLFLVGMTCFGAIGLYREDKRKTVFVAVLASLFTGLITSVSADIIYLTGFRRLGEDGFWVKDEAVYNTLLIVWTVLVALVYVKWIEPRLLAIISSRDLPLEKFVTTPLVSIFAYSVLIKILAGAGIDLYNPKMTLLGIVVYLTVLVIFIILYKDMFLSMEVSGELAKTEAEINVAETLQRSILPNIFPPYPDRTEFDIYAVMYPCQGVGGDFYDFFLIDEKHLAVVIADVSGKGIPAALFMMSARTLINTYANSGLSLQDMVNKVNNRLCDGNDTSMFVTVFLGILNIGTKQFRFINAGHNRPVISYDGKNYQYIDCEVNFILGAMEDMTYIEETVELKQGSVIYLYTDGVTESLNTKKEMYSDERLLDLMNRHITESTAKNMIEAVYQDIRLFAGEEPQADDITMLALKIN